MKLVGAFVDMEVDLTLDVTIDTTRAKDVDEASKPGHGGDPFVPSDVAKHPADTLGEACPAVFLVDQLLAALRRQGVEARLTVLLGGGPLGPEQTVLFHDMPRRIQRS